MICFTHYRGFYTLRKWLDYFSAFIFKKAPIGGRTYSLLNILSSRKAFLQFLSFVCCIAFMLTSLPEAGAQIAEGEIKQLEIGDTIPEALWNLPMQVVNHPEGKETVTLNEYKDKLIILDFWATWCAPCVKSLPEVLRLQDSLPTKVIALSDEPSEKLIRFLSNRTDFPDSEFYIYERKSLWDVLFKRSSIPHTVILYEGVVRSITLPTFLNKEVLVTVMNNDGPLEIPKKTDLDEIKKTLLGVTLEDYPSASLNYTVTMKGIKGMVPKMRWISDSSTMSKRLAISNYSLHSLLATATQRGDLFLRNPNRIMIKEEGAVREIKGSELSFLKEFKMSYEGVYPFHSTFETAANRLLDDLDLFKGMKVSFDTLLIVEDSYTFSDVSAKETNTSATHTMSEVMAYLNRHPRGKIAHVDKKDASKRIHLKADLESMSPEEVERELLLCGWKKQRCQKKMEVLVLKTRGNLSKGGV